MGMKERKLVFFLFKIDHFLTQNFIFQLFLTKSRKIILLLSFFYLFLEDDMKDLFKASSLTSWNIQKWSTLFMTRMVQIKSRFKRVSKEINKIDHCYLS